MSHCLRLIPMILIAIMLMGNTGCTRGTSSSAKQHKPDSIKHTVEVGETITMIATKYGVSVPTIIDANNLYSRLLRPGSTLYIPGGKVRASDPVEPEVPVAPESPAGLVDSGWYIPRASWEAKPVVVSRTKPMGGTPTRITVHHSGNIKDTQFNSRDWLRRIDVNHMNGVGHSEPWACIGYHFIIDASGKIYEGRPLRYQGAHAGNDRLNQLNIGICLIGNFETTRVPSIQRRVLLETLDRLCLKYGINRAEVHGHGEFKITDCPGRNLTAIINAYASRPTDTDPDAPVHAAIPSGATRLGGFLQPKP